MPLDANFVQMPSGLLLPEHHAEREIQKMRKPRAMDFFAGAGGFSLGLIQAGYEVVAAAEYDPVAVMTYMTNLCRYGEVQMHFVEDADKDRMEKALSREYKKAGTLKKDSGEPTRPLPMAGSGWIANEPLSTPGVSHIFIGDVRKLTGQQILHTIGMDRGELDSVVGGPPCQGYSKAGKQNVYDPRNSLVFEYARFIVELQPKTMMMEEVPDILNMVTPDGHPVIDQFCRILEDGGFGGHDAFLKSLDAQASAMGLMRGRGSRKDAKRAEERAKKAAEDDQLALFS